MKTIATIAVIDTAVAHASDPFHVRLRSIQPTVGCGRTPNAGS
jgi:hypothetical protein